MAAPAATEKAQWSSRFAFVMAAVGSAVGLGNLWRFASEAGENGGGAFIVVYLMCVLFIGIPALMCEYAIGRASDKASAVQSVTDVARRSNASTAWSATAWIGMIAAFMVVCFYSVVAGWVIAYIPKFALGMFNGLSDEQISAQFGALNGSLGQEIVYMTIFVALTVWLVARGVNEGIEWAAKMLMPVFFFLLLALCAVALMIGDAGAAMSWMYLPDFSAINPSVAVSALGQAFFSLSLGSAIMITYGSYLPRGINIPRSSAIVGGMDTFVAVVAGMAIFPIVFALGMSPDSGAGLFFQTLPVALHSVPGGNLFGTAFFVLALFAAVTSSISLLEVSTAYLVDKLKLSRTKMAIALGAGIWVVGALCAYSDAFFGALDNISGKIMLPLAALIAVLFVGWRMTKEIRDQEIEGLPAPVMRVLYLLIRFIAPAAIAIILIMGAIQQWAPGLYQSIFPPQPAAVEEGAAPGALEDEDTAAEAEQAEEQAETVPEPEG